MKVGENVEIVGFRETRKSVCTGRTSSIGRDLQQAAYWFQKSAEQGQVDAELELGEMYLAGNGVSKDSLQASIWLRKAAEQGNAEAEYQLWIIAIGNKRYALFLINDEELAEMPDAFEHLRKAADGGYTLAQADIGEVLCNFGYLQEAEDSMVCKDVIPYIESAARTGNVRAQVALGDVYSGEEQSWVDANKDFDREHPTSMKITGGYPRYQRFPYDCLKGLKWYKQAAIQGDRYAIGAIGRMYEASKCVPSDPVRACGWLALAISIGGEDYPKSPENKGIMELAEGFGMVNTPAARKHAFDLANAELGRLKARGR